MSAPAHEPVPLPPPSFPRRAAVVALALAAVWSASESALIADPGAARFAALCACVGLAFLLRAAPRSAASAAYLALAVGCGWIARDRPGIEAGLLALAGAFAYLLSAARTPALPADSVALTVVYAGLVLGAQASEPLRAALDAVGAAYSAAVGAALDAPARLGPTPLGVLPAAAGALFVAAACVSRRPPRPAAAAVAALAVLAAPFVSGLLLVKLRGFAPAGSGSRDAAFLFAFPWATLPTTAAALAFLEARRAAPAEAPRGRAPRARLAAAAAAVVVALIGAATALPGGERPVRPGVVRILCRAAFAADFRSPTWERLGFSNGGMYGELVRLLRLTGREADVRPDPLTDADLARTSTLVIVTPVERLGAAELAALRRFVDGGGGLLLLGDHTDLLGMREPFNEIAAPYGVELRFDTAMESARGFVANLDCRRIGVAAAPIDAVRTQILHGASLRCAPPARPWVVGRRMFGDFGDRGNGGSGGYLGDYRCYAAAEAVGDVAVVAAAESGAGRVVAFGDTSTFQNVALPRSTRFVLDVFDWLAGAGPPRDAYLPGAALALAGLVVAAGLLRTPRAARDVAATGLFAALVAALGPTRLELDNAVAAGRFGGKAFLMHAGDLPLYDVDQFATRSIQGALACAAREGWWPVVGDLRAVGAPAALRAALLPPHARGDADVDRRAEETMAAGGAVVVAAGYGEDAGFRDLLARHGLAVAPTPLGAAPVLRYDQLASYRGPRFADAWPVVDRDPARGPVERLFATDDLAVAVRRPAGRGTLTAIGDGRLLEDKNLEGETACVEGAVAFFRDRVLAPLRPSKESRR